MKWLNSVSPKVPCSSLDVIAAALPFMRWMADLNPEAARIVGLMEEALRGESENVE